MLRSGRLNLSSSPFYPFCFMLLGSTRRGWEVLLLGWIIKNGLYLQFQSVFTISAFAIPNLYLQLAISVFTISASPLELTRVCISSLPLLCCTALGSPRAMELNSAQSGKVERYHSYFCPSLREKMHLPLHDCQILPFFWSCISKGCETLSSRGIQPQGMLSLWNRWILLHVSCFY